MTKWLSILRLEKAPHLMVVAVLSLVHANALFGQNNPLSEITAGFADYSIHHVQEKLFVHTDKKFYVAGEIVWFKIYEVAGGDNKPADFSKVVYVELLNEDLKAVLQAKIALSNGAGKGSLFLPVSLASGTYRFRSYTNWMKNFSPEFFFEKDITIVNSLKKLPQASPSLQRTAQLQFFPEGGNLVNNIETRVGFHVANAEGNGISGKGSIVDQNNNTVANFEPLKFGIGSFNLTPKPGYSYKAIFKTSDGDAIISKLPKIYEHGYSLRLAAENMDKIRVTVHADSSNSSRPVYLIVHTRNTVKAAEILIPEHGEATVLMNRNKLGEGISHFTLFNSERKPICERLFFTRPSRMLQIDAKAEFEQYATRKKVYIDILARDEQQHPTVADLSVSVFLTDSLQHADQSAITAYFWLSSDLHGRVESPEYYFGDADSLADEAADNLMLTHGWRRFRWEEVNSTVQDLEFLPEYEGHILTGKVTDRRTGQPAKNIPTYLTVPGEHFQLSASVSNEVGKVQFDVSKFYATSEIIAETGTRRADSVYRIDITNPYSEKFSASSFRVFDIPRNLESQLLTHSVGAQVHNAYYTENIQRFQAPAEFSDSTPFYGQPDRKYFLDDYTRFGTMEEVMREYVTGILVKKQQGKFHIQMMDDSWHRYFEDDPLILLDGVPIFDIDKIIAFDPFKVKKVELVNRQYFLGSLVADGVVSYSTYKGDLGGFQLDPNAVIIEYGGLQLQREFYSPAYETAAQVQSSMPDFRNVLYWSPDAGTNDKGKKQFSFFTSDRKGHYTVMVQGIAADGRSGSKMFSFDVAN